MNRTAPAALVLLALAIALFSGCGRKRAAADMPILSARATYERGLEQISNHKLFQALSTLQMVDLRYDIDERADLEPLVKLAVADATFYQDTVLSLIDARTLYEEFVTLYADHPRAPYAQFQIGMCALKQVNHPTKDQSQTHRAMGGFRRVQLNYPSSRYATAAQLMIQKAQANLAEHEYMVGRFYMKRKAYPAAISRFRKVVDTYPEYPRKDLLFLQLARSLMADDNTLEARIFYDILLRDYPDTRYAEEARKQLIDAGGRTDLGLEAAAD